MIHGAVDVCAEDRIIKKRLQAIEVKQKKSVAQSSHLLRIDTENVLNVMEFEAVLFSFKEISNYKLQLPEPHKLIIQITITSGYRFDDFDQSLALRVGQFFKSKAIGGLRFLIQEI